jgi:hypothetical protein
LASCSTSVGGNILKHGRSGECRVGKGPHERALCAAESNFLSICSLDEDCERDLTVTVVEEVDKSCSGRTDSKPKRLEAIDEPVGIQPKRGLTQAEASDECAAVTAFGETPPITLGFEWLQNDGLLMTGCVTQEKELPRYKHRGMLTVYNVILNLILFQTSSIVDANPAAVGPVAAYLQRQQLPTTRA